MQTAAAERTDSLDQPVRLEPAAASGSASEPVAGVEPPRSRAATTRRYYAADWATFQAWCRTETCQALPAAPASVAAYLAADAGRLCAGTLRRRLAAIADQHRRLGYPTPVGAPVRDLLRQARRRRVSSRSPLSAIPLARMAAACPGDLAGLRDRALLCLAAATGLGRADLVGLDVEDLRFDGAGVALHLRGREAAAAESRTVSRKLPVTACPVHALADWLLVSDTGFGPVFRKIDRWGNIEHRRLGTDALRRIWQRRALAGHRA